MLVLCNLNKRIKLTGVYFARLSCKYVYVYVLGYHPYMLAKKLQRLCHMLDSTTLQDVPGDLC